MGYRLSDDEAMIRKMVGEFAREQVGLETAAEQDRHDRFPAEPLAAAAGLGLTLMGLPAEQGGAGVTPTALALAIDELAQVDPNSAAILSLHNGLALRALAAASDDLRGRLLASAAEGKTIAVLATEEAHGSDTSKVNTRAEPAEDGGYILTGQKAWGLGAAGAAHFLVLADVPDGGPTLFAVPSDASGVTLGRNEPLLGLRASGIRTVYLAGVTVAAGDVVGEVGQGAALLDEARPWLKVAAAAALTGCTAGAMEQAARFAESRIQFGEPIGKYQAVSDSVTQMGLQVAASRALYLEAAAALEDDPDAAPAAAARAKLHASETAIWMTRKAIRVMGGTGFMREGIAERFLRDARALQFIGETAQMQREILKRDMLDIDFPAT
ncbi:MAG: acyl-CoA dehydrogenase family protein [Thermoplasmatota archaeon]